jgi:hypothetical protein
MPFKALEALKWIKHTKNSNFGVFRPKIGPLHLYFTTKKIKHLKWIKSPIATHLLCFWMIKLLTFCLESDTCPSMT